MEIKKWWKKLKIWKKSGVILIILFLLFIMILFFYPVPVLIEDRPFFTFICELNPFTYVAENTTYTCNNEQDWTFQYLKKWKRYHGCNESTNGYDEKGHITNLASC